MTALRQLFLLIGFIIAFVLFGCLYTVTEGQEAIVLRLGKIVSYKDGQPVVALPGLHVKLPLVDSVRWFDMRLQTLSVESSRILTQEQKYVLVDYYAKWRIDNMPLYYTRTSGDADQAKLLLQQKINDSLRAEFGRRMLSDVISDAREGIMKKLQEETNNNAKDLGIKVIDVRIKRIDLPTEVSASVFERMRAERELVAAKHRADGKATAEQIQAEADGKASVIIASAQAQAAKIRSEGEAQAAKIYAEAYGKDPEFYAFYRSLEAYRAVFNNKDNNILVLKPDNEFFKYFNQESKEKGRE
jgi:membrane protease subunit HflC